ncbi:MAG: TldD/PmbA family protein [Armatimonadetes bacterium]|nr:TldD/PmbA family protein [Armatimonadota bacterium]
MKEKDLAEYALDYVTSNGATYADVRLVQIRHEMIEYKNGSPVGILKDLNGGMGIRVIVDGAWGFAANPDFTKDKVERAAKRAVENARAGALIARDPIVMAPIPVVNEKWETRVETDPFRVSLEEKLALLSMCDQTMRKVKGLSFAEGFLDFTEELKFFYSSEGSRIDQKIVHSGGGIQATAIGEDETQVRSYPQSFGGDYVSGGYEHILGMNLPDSAQKIAEEAVGLLVAPQCPEETTTLILGEGQLALQVHESCGHPVELDRALGWEANFAGTSFMTPDRLGKLQYGSGIVNIVSDPTHPGGLGSYGFDDEGTPAKRDEIVRDGLFVGYLMSRETAAGLGRSSNAAMRAEGWSYAPIVRMTNVNLLPQKGTLDDLISETKKGLLMTTNRSWSIDDRRLNFQFGCEIAWEIRNGKIAGFYKNPTYTGITPVFWNKCGRIAGPESWRVWGVPNCGKGQPMQTMRVGHGVSYARFDDVQVGVGYAH